MATFISHQLHHQKESSQVWGLSLLPTCSWRTCRRSGKGDPDGLAHGEERGHYIVDRGGQSVLSVSSSGHFFPGKPRETRRWRLWLSLSLGSVVNYRMRSLHLPLICVLLRLREEIAINQMRGHIYECGSSSSERIHYLRSWLCQNDLRHMSNMWW